MNEDKVRVNELETFMFFSGSQRLPRAFYYLTSEEQAEVIRIYRRRNGLDKNKPPWKRNNVNDTKYVAERVVKMHWWNWVGVGLAITFFITVYLFYRYIKRLP
jgi:hypothetical protein